jgi:hypothetical protein
MVKHYLVIAHRGPAQVHRLVRHLDDGSSQVWIHLDAKSSSAGWEWVAEHPAATLVTPRQACVWGAWSQVESILVTLRAALRSNRPGYVVLLSGQDYPVKSAAAIDTYLSRHSNAVHLEGGTLAEVWGERASWKTDSYCVPFSGDRGDLKLIPPLSSLTPRERVNWARLLVGREGLRAGLRLVADLTPPRRAVVANQRGGASWWGMPWTVATSVLEYLDAHPEFERYYRYTQCPDEIIFHTVIEQLRLAGQVGKVLPKLTHVVWPPDNTGSPKVFGMEDLAALLALPEHVLFARKLDLDHDAELFDALDKAIDGTLQARGHVMPSDEPKAGDAP